MGWRASLSAAVLFWMPLIWAAVPVGAQPAQPPATLLPDAPPAVAEPPVAEPPVTEPPVTDPPATETPVTETPAIDPTARFDLDAAALAERQILLTIQLRSVQQELLDLRTNRDLESAALSAEYQTVSQNLADITKLRAEIAAAAADADLTADQARLADVQEQASAAAARLQNALAALQMLEGRIAEKTKELNALAAQLSVVGNRLSDLRRAQVTTPELTTRIPLGQRKLTIDQQLQTF